MARADSKRRWARETLRELTKFLLGVRGEG